MSCSKTANRKIESSQRRALKITNNTNSTNLPVNQSIHVKNLHFLMKEIYMSLNKLNPKFMWDFWIKKTNVFNLRQNDALIIPKPRAESFGYRSLSFRGAVLWNSLPPHIKSSPNITKFKANIKQWNAENCECNLCRTWILSPCFIQNTPKNHYKNNLFKLVGLNYSICIKWSFIMDVEYVFILV